MTRKDYIAIAGALQTARLEAANDNRFSLDGRFVAAESVLTAAENVADAMSDDNPRFDREHFLAIVRGERNLNSRPPR